MEAFYNKDGSGCFTEMEIDMLVNTLEIKSMVLGFITLPMAIVMRDHGMKAESKVMAVIFLETVTESAVNGISAASRLLYLHQMMQSFGQCR